MDSVVLVSKVTTQKFKMVQSENIFWIFCAHWIFFRHVVSLSTNSDRRCKLLQYLRRTPRMSQMRGFHTFLSTLQRCKLYLSDFNFLFLSFNLQMFFLFLLFIYLLTAPRTTTWSVRSSWTPWASWTSWTSRGLSMYNYSTSGLQYRRLWLPIMDGPRK